MKGTSFSDPYKYLTYITPKEGTGAKGIAEKIIEFLAESKSWEYTVLEWKMEPFLMKRLDRGEMYLVTYAMNIEVALKFPDTS